MTRHLTRTNQARNAPSPIRATIGALDIPRPATCAAHDDCGITIIGRIAAKVEAPIFRVVDVAATGCEQRPRRGLMWPPAASTSRQPPGLAAAPGDTTGHASPARDGSLTGMSAAGPLSQWSVGRLGVVGAVASINGGGCVMSGGPEARVESGLPKAPTGSRRLDEVSRQLAPGRDDAAGWPCGVRQDRVGLAVSGRGRSAPRRARGALDL